MQVKNNSAYFNFPENIKIIHDIAQWLYEKSEAGEISLNQLEKTYVDLLEQERKEK